MNDETINEEYMEYYIYLHNLKLSGVVNMFGAAPYIADEFFIARKHARNILRHWMRVYPLLLQQDTVAKEIIRRNN